MLLLAAPPAAPLFTTRFVKYHPDTFGSQIELADARRDGSAVGKVVRRMTVEWFEQGLFLFGGRDYGPGPVDDSGATWMPLAILGDCLAAVEPACWRADRLGKGIRQARFVGGRLRVAKGFVPAPKVAARLTAFEEAPVPFPREVWGRRFPRRVDWTEPIVAKWYRLPGGARVGGAWIDPYRGEIEIPPGNYEQPLAFVGTPTGTRPLGEVVPGGFRFGQIVWVSPEGWFVATAEQGSGTKLVRYLVWLTPAAKPR